MATPRPSSRVRSARAARAVAEPDLLPPSPLYRALNRIKGEGRRRVVVGLFQAGVPLSRVPRLLLRENLTAFEHAVLWHHGTFSLAGERLPDLLPREVEEVRISWSLSDDQRLLSLRARPGMAGAVWRLVDDVGSVYELPRTFTRWPVTDLELVALLDGARASTLPHGLGAIRSCWEEARRQGLPAEAVRDSISGRTIRAERRLKEAVDELFERYQEEAGFGGAAAELPAAEVVQ